MKHTPFTYDSPDSSPGFLLWQTTATWQRMIKEQLEVYDVSHAQFVIMAILLWMSKEKKEVTQIEIVNMSKLDKMTVSKSLKKLGGVGLVERYENKDDTRAKSVVLSKEGIKLIKNLVPLVEAIDKNFFSQLANNEELKLIKLLRKLN